MESLPPRTAGLSEPGSEPAAARADERTLIAAILQNDRKAAALLVTGHIDAIYAFARHRLIPRVDLADDVVQRFSWRR